MSEEKNNNISLGTVSAGKGGEMGSTSLLVAISENGVIGANNQLPWHLPADLKYFKNLTWGLPVIMGRKTFESIGKPLPGRQNIVVTTNKEWKANGVTVVHTTEQALQQTNEVSVKEIFIIGGAQIFAATLPVANRIYLTRIHHHFDGDIFFDPIKDKPNNWKLARETVGTVDEKNKWPHSFQVWERR